MRMLRAGIPIFLSIIVCGCSPWRSWIPEHPNNEAYQQSGYGKDNRYYSKQNVDGMLRQIKATQLSGVPMDRNRAMASRERLAYSIEIDKRRVVARSKNYFENYKNTLFADERIPSTDDPMAAQRDYFDPNQYNRLVPQENIFKIRRLRTADIMPMTESVADNIKKYHQYTHPSEEREAKVASLLASREYSFNKGAMEYRMDVRENRGRQNKVTNNPRDLVLNETNERFLDQQRTDLRYYRK